MSSRSVKIKEVQEEINNLENLLKQKNREKTELLKEKEEEKIFSCMFSADFIEHITENYCSPLDELEQEGDNFLGIVGMFKSHTDAAEALLKRGVQYWDREESVLGEFAGKPVISVTSLEDNSCVTFGVIFDECSASFKLKHFKKKKN